MSAAGLISKLFTAAGAFRSSIIGAAQLDAGTVVKRAAIRAAITGAPISALAAHSLFINGGMEISQENGSTAGGHGTYPVDQMQFSIVGPSGNCQQVTDAPPGYRNSAKITITTAKSSLASTDLIFLYTNIEGLRIAKLGFGATGATSFGLGFWAKSSVTGTHGAAIGNHNGGRSYPFTYTISAANTWEYKAIYIPGDVGGTWVTGAVLGLQVIFSPAIGSSFLGTAGAWVSAGTYGQTGQINLAAVNGSTFQVTGVALLPGIDLTALDQTELAANSSLLMRDAIQELPLCQRYFFQPSTGNPSFECVGLGFCRNTTTAVVIVKHPVEMRIGPSLTSSSPSDFYVDNNGAHTATAIALDTGGSSNRRSLITATTTGLNTGDGCAISAFGTTSARISLNARM